MRSELTNIPDPRKSKASPYRESNKKKMRQQFELQLFAFNKEEVDHQEDNFIVKDFKTKLHDEDHLNERISELKGQIEKDKEEMEAE